MKPKTARLLWGQRDLIRRLTHRDITGKYKGSALGAAWSLLTPLLMLAVYTFVFSEVFQSRWTAGEDQGTLDFAVNLFTGLIIFNLFAETVNNSPDLITRNPNYVKKVVFPLEILPAVTLGSAMFNGAASLVILLLFKGLAAGGIPVTAAWLPLVCAPILCLCLSASWILSALGVYLRDIGQATGVLTSILMFLSAVFYPIESLPERWQPLLSANPIAYTISQARNVLIEGIPPNVPVLITFTAVGVLACEASLILFRKAKRGFADVL